MPTPMNSGNTRITRSRFSSPQTTPGGNGTRESLRAPSATGQQSLITSWLEPPVNIRASYQDAGLVRHGVVENMAPLGTMPKVGVFKKTAPPPVASPAAPPTPEPTRAPTTTKIKIINRAAVPSTPTPTPPVAAPPAPEEDETEEEEGDDYAGSDGGQDYGRDVTPVHTKTPSGRAIASRAGHRDREGTWDTEKPSPSYNSVSGRSMSRASIGQNGSLGLADESLPSGFFDRQREVCDRVVEAAVDEALANFRYPTAWALRVLYDENFENAQFIDMLEQIFHQTASQDTLVEFARLVHEKKKQGKKGKTSAIYFAPDEIDRLRKPLPAPHGHLLKFDTSVLHLGRKRAANSEHPSQPSGPSERSEQPETEAKAEPAVEPAQLPEAVQETEPEQDTEPEIIEPVPGLKPEGESEAGPELEPVPEREAEPEPEPQQDQPESEPTQEPEREPTPTPPVPPPHPQKHEPEREPPASARKKRRSARHSGSAIKMSGANGVNGKIKTDSPSRRRTRARSLSSSSSLSSTRSITPPAEIEEGDEEAMAEDASMLDVTPSRASPAAERGERKRERSNTGASAQPITKRRRRSNAPKKNGNVSPAHPPPSTSPPATAQDSTSAHPSPLSHEQPYDMPAVLDTPQFPNQGSKKGSRSGNNGIVFASKVGKIDEDDPKWLLRQNAKKVSNTIDKKWMNSYLRADIEDTSQIKDGDDSDGPAGNADKSARAAVAGNPATSAAGNADEPAAVAAAPPSRPRTAQPQLQPGRSTPAASNARNTRSSRKRSHDEVEDQVSPTTLHFASQAPSTAANSRAGTPALRAAKKARTGLRVKTSPMKKKGGPLAGIPRASGERSSPVGNGTMAREDDNDDYCSSCGGNGELICCDGCTRSFHIICLDPPLGQDSMPAEWFCNVCRTARNPPSFPIRRHAFGELLVRLDAKNSSAFNLPFYIRDYFEGVRTNADGEYEEIVPVVKTGRKKKSDEDQVPDFYRLRDAEGNAVICHCCQKSSGGTRPIIPCSLCGLYWHLDCLDPPLANPPVLRTWKCPCHIDDLLTKVPGTLAPAHKFRKIKGAPMIHPAYSRGYVNNGYIDVELDSRSEDESGWKDFRSYGRTVRLPEQGIKLDFLSRARVNRKGKPIQPLNATHVAPSTPAPGDNRTLDERQAALNLTQLSGQGDGAVTTLVDTLVAQADPSVIAMMARGSAQHFETGNLNNMDQQSLRAMLTYMESVSQKVRSLLEPVTPDRQTSPQAAIPGSASTIRELGARVPSLTNSQTTEAESEVPGAGLATIPNSQQQYIPMDSEAKNISSPSASVGDAPAADGDIMDDTETTTTVIPVATETVLPAAITSEEPIIKTEPAPAAEAVDSRTGTFLSNREAAIVIEPTPPPESQPAASIKKAGTPVTMVIDGSNAGTDDKNDVMVTEVRAVDHGSNAAVEMVDAPVMKQEPAESERDGRDANNAMDLD